MQFFSFCTETNIYFINVFVAKLGTAATGNFLSGKRERGAGGGGGAASSLF
jgi:hypothetical protein